MTKQAIYSVMIAEVMQENSEDESYRQNILQELEAISARIEARNLLIESWRRKLEDGKTPVMGVSIPQVSHVEISKTPRRRPPLDSHLDYQALFEQNEFEGMTQVDAVAHASKRVAERGDINVAFTVDSALGLLEWVGCPIKGESEYHRRQNASKLLRLHDNITSAGRGRYKFSVDEHSSPTTKVQSDVLQSNGFIVNMPFAYGDTVIKPTAANMFEDIEEKSEKSETPVDVVDSQLNSTPTSDTFL